MTDLERIANEKWRTAFLKKIEMLDGFHELVEHSRNPNQPELNALRISSHAAQILAQYTKEELQVARLHYNTQQLLGYWRYYREHLEAGISNGRVSRSFPLVSATNDPVNRRVKLDAINIHQMKGGLFIKTDRSPRAPSFERVELNHEQALLDGALSTNAVLDSLYGRLALIARSFYETSVILYQMFLSRERQAASATWDSYKIHVFLDTFMYRLNNGNTRTSKFDFVFFANNRLELLVWLDSFLKAGKPLSLEQAEKFLNNQTKHYLRLSQHITLEENEVLNCHKELLLYDEIQNVVCLGNIPPEILEKCRKPIQDLGLTSRGCPFARAKGVKINALTEMYQYTDQLFLRTLEASWEFKHFSTNKKPA